MVRLKERNRITTVNHGFVFQFHYGTIKRHQRHDTRRDKTNFNSTMVRLKATLRCSVDTVTRFQFHYGTIKRSTTIKYFKDLFGFQFHYGTIKSIRGNKFGSTKLHFNSTMVRLKGSPRLRTLYARVFQFHYGTIKSPLIEIASQIADISIPLWYD